LEDNAGVDPFANVDSAEASDIARCERGGATPVKDQSDRGWCLKEEMR
jgi:hypothetical protein